MRIHRSGQAQTFLKKHALEKTAYDEKSKKDKGLSAAMWLLQSEGKRFLTTVSALKSSPGTTLGKVRS